VGQDPKSARLIQDVVQQMADRGSAVIVTTHTLEIAERRCDRIGIISVGKPIHGWEYTAFAWEKGADIIDDRP